MPDGTTINIRHWRVLTPSCAEPAKLQAYHAALLMTLAAAALLVLASMCGAVRARQRAGGNTQPALCTAVAPCAGWFATTFESAADTSLPIDSSGHPRFAAAVSAGLLNRLLQRPAALVALRGVSDHLWLGEAKRQDEVAANTAYTQISAYELVDAAVQNKAATAAVLYNASELHSIANVATLCGIHTAVPLADTAAAASWGLPVVFDARGRWPDAMVATQYAATVLLPQTSTDAMVLQDPALLLNGYLVDLVAAGMGSQAGDGMPLLAIWPESPYTNPQIPSICNLSSPEHALFGNITEGSMALAHGWKGPGVPALPTVIGYHNKGPGAWAESVNLCTPLHRTLSLVGDYAANLAWFSRFPPVETLTQPAPIDAGPYSADKTYVAIIVSDGDNMQIDQGRIDDSDGLGISSRASTCAQTGASCPPLSWTMSNRLAEFAPIILRWWYQQATLADSFVLGPSGFGYVYPALLSEHDSAIWANATAEAARRLGMTGYVHWDILGSWDAAMPGLRDVARTSLEVALVASVPDILPPGTQFDSSRDQSTCCCLRLVAPQK